MFDAFLSRHIRNTKYIRKYENERNTDHYHVTPAMLILVRSAPKKPREWSEARGWDHAAPSCRAYPDLVGIKRLQIQVTITIITGYLCLSVANCAIFNFENDLRISLILLAHRQFRNSVWCCRETGEIFSASLCSTARQTISLRTKDSRNWTGFEIGILLSWKIVHFLLGLNKKWREYSWKKPSNFKILFC